MCLTSTGTRKRVNVGAACVFSLLDPPRPRPPSLIDPPPPSIPSLIHTGSGDSPYGAYFPDLPANALGCFLMGLLAASSTLTLGDPKPLAALPAAHPWQAAPELHIGLRTGFCGSLTTLSGWTMALTLQLVGGDGRAGRRPAQWAWGWVVGLHVALGSYALGEHAARLADDRARPVGEERALARAVRAVAEEEDLAAGIGRSAAGGVVPRVSLGGENGRGGGPASTPPASWADAAAAAAGVALASRGEVALTLTDLAVHHAARPPGEHGPGARAAVAERVADLRAAAAAERARGVQHAPRLAVPARLPPPPPPTADVCVSASELAARVAQSGAVPPPGRKSKGHHGHGHGHGHHQSRRDRARSLAATILGTRPDAAVGFVTRTHILVGLLGFALWVGMAAAVVFDGGGSEARRARWGAVLLAPPGCMLRWCLAPLNYRLRGRFRSLPGGTLAANALGCLCTALLSVVAVRALPPAGSGGGPASGWGRVATRAAQAGFCGALSTVSTLMAEAASQLRRVPADASGYAYLGLTWAVAVVVTVVAYGPAVWV